MRSLLQGRASLVTLFVILFTLSLAVDPLSSLGSDVGGKTATMAALSSQGSLDLGYWAAPLDPDGSLYPFFGTSNIDGMWVNATTFPMLFLAWPLHQVGGMHLAMVLPILGGVLTASAARRMAVLLGHTDGTAAFWVVGLATPATVYSLAFWEHAPGLALMAWGVVYLMTAIDTRRLGPAMAAGLLFGAAATMRQEALVYGAAAGVWLMFALLRERHVMAMVRSSASMAGGALAVLVANAGFERLVLGTSFRSARATGAAAGAGSELGARVHDALLTVLVPSDVSLLGVVMGVLFLLGSFLILRNGRPLVDQPMLLAIVGLPMILLVLTMVVDGRSFVPSLLFTTPLAGIGIQLGCGSRRTRGPAMFAVLSLPVVLAVQSTGGFEAQWGGRYLLLSGWLLTVIACSQQSRIRADRFAIMTAISIGVTALGIGWTIERSQAMGQFYGEVAAMESPVVVFDSALTARGAGELVFDQPMLAAETADARSEAAEVLFANGTRSFVFLSPDVGSALPAFPGFDAVDSTTIDFVSGLRYRATTFAVAA